jgi:hypothetical protein
MDTMTLSKRKHHILDGHQSFGSIFLGSRECVSQKIRRK